MKEIKKFISFIIVLSVVCCTEPIELKTELFQDVLVVESNLTNELSFQKVKVSRSFLLEDSTPVIEKNAQVWIEDSVQNTYSFTETENGIYVSDVEFKAATGIGYKLFIKTMEGNEFESVEEFLTPESDIGNLYAEIETVEGVEGVQVYIDSSEDLNLAKYYRYEYEETYKIVIPNFSHFDAQLSNASYDPSKNNELSYDIRLVQKTKEEEVCYSTKFGTEILLTNIDNLAENKISKFPIRFIPSDDSVLRERYSILVKQYAQSVEAYNFYKILRDLGSESSLLVDNQPGFIQGNISSTQNANKKVVGFFDVSWVTTKRIYFNYADFDLEYPPYFFDCDIIELDYSITIDPFNHRILLYQLLSSPEIYKFQNRNGSVYTIINSECADCTSFSSNIKPEFWTE